MENKKVLKTTILSISFLLMTRLTIAPALAEIGKAFPDVSQESLMMMVVMPSLVGILFGFLSSILAGFMKARTLLFIGLAGYLIGGIGPVFTDNYSVLMGFRILLGAGTGLFLPFASGLIAQFFSGHERNQMLGFQSASIGLGNIITSLLAGLLAAMFWKFSFLIYCFGFVTLIMVFFFLPEPEKASDENKARMTKEMYFNKGVLWVFLMLVLYAIIYFAFFGYLAFVIDSKGLGDAKAAGLATMLMTLASMIMGISFGKILQTLKKYTLTTALVINVIAYFTLAGAASIGAIFAGSLLLGAGFGFLMPYAFVTANNYSDQAALNYTNGMLQVAVNVGSAMGPKVLVTIGLIFANPDGQFIFKCCAVALSFATVCAFIWTLVAPKNKEAAAAEA